MTILNEIVAHKRKEVAERRELVPLKMLEKSPYFSGQCVSFKKYLQRPDKAGVIAEIKRRSPSKGVLTQSLSVEELSIRYMQAGASALSVLTDEKFFGGTNEDLTTARRFNFCPILRKDFIIDEYQVVEAKAIGADAILLIAAVLEPAEVRTLSALAKQLGLETLLEVHTAEECARSITAETELVGVNNRNLDDFSVDVQRSIALAPLVPPACLKISESGISSPQTIRTLKQHGFKGFLIGEAFMRTPDPARSCMLLIEALTHDESQRQS